MISYYFNSLLPDTFRAISDDYEIRPKPHVIKRNIQNKKTELENAKRIRDMLLDQYTRRIDALQREIDELEISLKSASD